MNDPFDVLLAVFAWWWISDLVVSITRDVVRLSIEEWRRRRRLKLFAKCVREAEQELDCSRRPWLAPRDGQEN